jgi:hypothetical protein
MKRGVSQLESDEDSQFHKRRKLDEENTADVALDSQILPKETWLHILSGKHIMLVNSIDFKNILAFREVNKYFRQIIDESEDLSWAILYFNHFGGYTDTVKYSTNSWKQIYLDARSALKKVFEERELEDKADLLDRDDDLTLDKAEEDFDDVFGQLYNDIDGDDELYDKLAEFVCDHNHCSLVSAYLYGGEHNMDVFHLLFAEKYYKTWSRYNNEANFDQMHVVGLLFEDQIGSDGIYNIDIIPTVLDMTVRGGMEGRLYTYWKQEGTALRAELEAQGHQALIEQIEKIAK